MTGMRVLISTVLINVAVSYLHSTIVWAEKITQTGDKPTSLRVCADVANLPYSNKKGGGFENKIAAILADDLKINVKYYWISQHHGFVSRTLGSDMCDVLMSVPTKFGPVSTTYPYYTSFYVAITRAEDPRKFRSFDDPWLVDAKIGLQMVAAENSTTPPVVALSRRGLHNHIQSYAMWSEKGSGNPQARIIEAVAKGEIDVAFVWGPFAGYFGKKYSKKLIMEPITGDHKTPEYSFVFPMSVGVRKTDLVFRDRLQQALDRHAEKITKILKEYNIPLMPNEKRPTFFQQSQVTEQNNTHTSN